MSGRKPWLSKKLEGLGPQFYSDLESALNFGFNGIWHDLFFGDGFFFTNLRPENNRVGANTGFWRFSSKIGVFGFNMILFKQKNQKKVFFAQIDYTLIINWSIYSNKMGFLFVVSSKVWRWRITLSFQGNYRQVWHREYFQTSPIDTSIRYHTPAKEPILKKHLSFFSL